MKKIRGEEIVYISEKFIEQILEEYIPNKIKKVGFDFDWDNKKIWKLKYPISTINSKELEWHLYIPFWGDYNLKPIDVINNPKKYSDEYNKIMKSDVKYPIDLMKNKKGKLVILDGLHRFVKIWMLKRKRIKVRIIPRKEIPNIEVI